MNKARLDRLQSQLFELQRKRVVTTSDLESFARKLGRRKLKGAQSRGKEPQWVSEEFPTARPISIPFHGRNAGMAPKTVKNILNDLEEDVWRLRIKYGTDKESKGDIQEFENYEH